jgi:hypothetical protein
MSEPIKISYRAFGGTLLFIFMVICGTIALAFLAAGLALIILSWLPYVSPEILETYRITFLGARIINPANAFLLFFISGLTMAAVGIILFGFVFYIVKTAQIIDKDFSESVERTFPSLKVLKGRKGKAILVLGIMLFGTFLTFLALFL